MSIKRILLSSAANYVVWSICTLLCSKSIACVFASGKQQLKSKKSLHPKTMSSFLNCFLPTEQAYYLALRSKWKLSHYYLWVLMRHFFGSLFQAWKFITTIISDSNTHIYSFSNQLCMQFRCAKRPPKSWTYSIARCFLFRSHCITKSTSTDRTVTLWCQTRTARFLLGAVV